LLAAYSERRADVMALVKKFGGQARPLKPSAWLKPVRRPPLSIGGKFQIVDEPSRALGKLTLPRLHIPHGLAFGSGEHATTCLLLRALAGREDWNGASVLDLGTGSGVLALATRLLGARKIVATDFDAEAVRTAKANEALNFPTAMIRWRCADVKKLRPTTRYDLVLANIFSGILIEAAPQIAASVAPGGQLWLSGVIRSQQVEVIAAYRRQKLKLDRVVSRGKWVMIQFRRN
jgi:ribosomal protein L11 methyltransferase